MWRNGHVIVLHAMAFPYPSGCKPSWMPILEMGWSAGGIMMKSKRRRITPITESNNNNGVENSKNAVSELPHGIMVSIVTEPEPCDRSEQVDQNKKFGGRGEKPTTTATTTT
jgi:hypothetical protein